MQCMIIIAEMITKSYKIQSCENTKITCKNKHLKHKNGQKNLKLYLFIEMYLFKKKKKMNLNFTVSNKVVRLST